MSKANKEINTRQLDNIFLTADFALKLNPRLPVFRDPLRYLHTIIYKNFFQHESVLKKQSYDLLILVGI